VIPLAPALQWSDQAPVDPLHLHVYPDHRGHGRGALYEDDGVSYAYERGEWTDTDFYAEASPDGECRIDTTVRGHGVSEVRAFDITVHCAPTGQQGRAAH